MVSSLSTLANNLSEGIHKIKYRHDDKKSEACRITYEVCYCFLECTSHKHDLIEYKSLCCNKNYQQKFDETLKELYHGLVLKKVYRVIIFNRNVWLKPYIDMNTDLRKKK